MINFEKAMQIALSYVKNIEKNLQIPLVITSQSEFLYGWVFCYNSKEYHETNNISCALAGNAPFVVNSKDGSICVFGTAYPLKIYLDEYIQNESIN